MKPLLLLIDFQNDYLTRSNLQPAAGQVVQIAAKLLSACREKSVPIIHVRTSVHRNPDDRMPHWKSAGRWICEPGTPGYLPPESLSEISGETIIEKQFFNGFSNPLLATTLQTFGCDTLFLAGVHLHACIRATALEGYERGLNVWIAEDAVASDDAMHAAITRRYLSARHINFAPAEMLVRMLESSAATKESLYQTIERRSPNKTDELLWTIQPDNATKISQAVTAAKNAFSSWRKTSIQTRAAILDRLADLLEKHENDIASLITRDIGKPITMSHAEVRRSAELIRAAANHDSESFETRCGDQAHSRHLPLGVVAVVTPWNNSLAIPAGKIAPALFYGNALVWKPSPVGSMVALRFLELLQIAFESHDGPLPVELCIGDQNTASLIAENPCVDGVSLSGSLAAGYALQEICARRHIPFQGELGGNNPAIVWDDADPHESMRQVAAGAFGFAGQRCTANRRLIVSEKLRDVWLERIQRATRQLVWGDPWNPQTVIGPLIDAAKRDSLAMLLKRAEKNGLKILKPHAEQNDFTELCRRGAYHPPVIVCCDNPNDEIVQEETFGPVLVVQRAKNFGHAIQLCNDVRQGLVAALFTNSDQRKEEFLDRTKAGILKINGTTADADATSPFGGWKASGVGPAEHGPCDREFFCRVQTIYEPQGRALNPVDNIYENIQNRPVKSPLADYSE
ncbi:MAG TPA: aldehyde dehydrogenase family protein [Phycisphaerae bacterium]|nr:aldehyde dehydrogenase family protein [Phycisphaerae bacterium]